MLYPMKKLLAIVVLGLLWSGTLYSKTLIPWKSKNNVELIWSCSSANSKFWMSFVLNNANPAMVFTSTKGSENIKSMNNLHSIAFRNPESSSNRSFIFYENAAGMMLAKRIMDISDNGSTANLDEIYYAGTKTAEKEYKKWLNLKSKNAREFIKFMSNYTKNLNNITSKLPVQNTIKYKCKLINSYKLN